MILKLFRRKAELKPESKPDFQPDSQPDSQPAPQPAEAATPPAPAPGRPVVLINAYCTVIAPPEPTFPHKLNARRTLADPALAPHLDGFVGFLASRRGDEMTRTLYQCIRHVQRVQTHLSLEVDEADLDAFSGWARHANAIVFLPDSSVRDVSGRMLVAPDGDANKVDGNVPFSDEALARRERVAGELAQQDIRVPASLPPVVSERELVLRPARAVATRALALLIVAVHGETLATQQDSLLAHLEAEYPAGFAALSPQERAFVQATDVSEQAIVDFSWRYEALQVLAWALGRVDTLPPPTQICDVAALVRVLRETGEAALLADAALRPGTQILDALDTHFRLHWAAVQARLDQRAAPNGLMEGVIRERHHALNWLTSFLRADWDEVETPT